MTTLESGLTIPDPGDVIDGRYEVEEYARRPEATMAGEYPGVSTNNWKFQQDTIVIKAFDEQRQTHVGIKAFIGEDAEALRKAEREASIHQELSRKAGRLVVPIMSMEHLTVLGDKRLPAIVTDWAAKGTYDTFVPKTEEDITEVLAAMARVAGALSVLAAEGYVHCDVRAGNIARSREGAKLMDLGSVAKADQSYKHIFGTAGYIPVETLETGISTQKRDTFALVTTAFRLLTGKMPYDVTTQTSTADAKEMLGYPVRNLDSKLEMLPKDVVDTFRRGLSPDADVRQTPRELAADGDKLLV